MTSSSGPRLALFLAVAHVSCGNQPHRPAAGAPVSPVYSQQTGRLEQIVSDRNGDGAIDTRAFMDGSTLQRIELDRTGDGRPDRWEHYRPADAGGSKVEIDRAEEANGVDERITRREFYAQGAVTRVEEDTDLDGRMDKWEHYERGLLAWIDLDLGGGGFADRRMMYRRDGGIDRVLVDREGRGTWRPLTPAGHAGDSSGGTPR